MKFDSPDSGEDKMIKKYVKQLHEWIRTLHWLWFGVPIIGLLTMSITGYLVILYGGKFVIDDEDFLLDAVTTIETKDGSVIAELYNERRYPVRIEQIPTHVQEAFVAIEDRRFYDHAGIDHKSVMRAIYKDLISFQKVEGASTITQQLVKNLALTNEKSWMRKTKEVMASIYIERKMTKDQILELYLNKIYFGQGLHGIEAAAQYYFSKTIADVSISEAALLAGIVKAPNGYSPEEHPDKALDRRNVVLGAMEDSGVIDADERIRQQQKALGLDIAEKNDNPAVDSYVDLVMKEAAHSHDLSIDELKRGGYRIIVHMDTDIQQVAYDHFQDDSLFPGSTDEVEGAFVMIDHKYGDVVAAIGGRAYEQGNLNRVTVDRQPGSVFKPLAVYAPALMTDEYTAYSMLPDQKESNPSYEVANADGQYAGSVSMYNAIVQSKNVPAVWLLNEIGIEQSKEYLDQLGMPIEDDGLAIALGGLSHGVSPLELVGGFRAFAQGGNAIQPQTISRIFDKHGDVYSEPTTNETKVFSEQVAWDMTEMLSYTVKHGTANVGNYDKALAGKTGSTEHPHAAGMYKDAWFVGYTPEYVSAFWMGFDHSSGEHYLTEGSRAPTEATKAILTAIDEQKDLASSFEKRAGVNDLQPPIELKQVTNVHGSFIFGGFSLIKGKIEWKAQDDDRIIYHIYEVQEEGDALVGEVEGGNSFVLDDISVWNPGFYYVVPYDGLTGIEGSPSEVVQLSF